MVKTYRSTLHTVYNIQQSATQGSNAMTRYRPTDCHAGQQQQPGLAQKGCQKQTAPTAKVLPTSDQVGFSSQPFTRWRHLSTHPINRPAAHLSTPKG